MTDLYFEKVNFIVCELYQLETISNWGGQSRQGKADTDDGS